MCCLALALQALLETVEDNFETIKGKARRLTIKLENDSIVVLSLQDLNFI